MGRHAEAVQGCIWSCLGSLCANGLGRFWYQDKQARKQTGKVDIASFLECFITCVSLGLLCEAERVASL